LALDGLQNEANHTVQNGAGCAFGKGQSGALADDFIITASSKEYLEDKVKPLVEKFLATRGLILSEKKTKITHVTEGFDFLGWNVRMFDRMLVTQPSKKNIKAFLGKIRSLLRERKTARQIEVIEKLTPVIRGWANYHRSQMASQTFAKCDHQIWQALWRWACRRHPNKGKRWIKQRYFQRLKGRDWRFTDQDKQLPILTGYRKRPHTKIKAEANPYDPAYDGYFSKRLAKRMEGTLEGRRKLRWLWWWQEGKCPSAIKRSREKLGGIFTT
jgi:RNA-directed DNA polymerase